MGQGQEIIARKYMATASLEGQWVLLQNTHLGLSYLTEVETYLVKEENIHEDFRFVRWGMKTRRLCVALEHWSCGMKDCITEI